MQKTKKSSLGAKRSRSIAATAPVQTVSKNTACDTSCWLCWLFKLMIALFVIMVIFWLGFCFGALSAQGPVKSYGQGGPKTCSMGKTCGQLSTGMNSNMGAMNHDMDSMMADMTAALEGKEGDAFDKEFLLQMIVHHEGAVEMAQEVLEKSERPELRTFAQSIIDTQAQEINQMKAWQTTWYK